MMIDSIICLVIVLTCALGCRNGMIWQVVNLITLIVGSMLAFLFHYPVAMLYRKVIEHPQLAGLLAYLSVYCAFGLFMFFVGAVLKGIVNTMHLKTADHLLGGALGAVKGLLLVCILLFVLVLYPVRGLHLENSRIAAPILRYMDRFFEWVMPGEQGISASREHGCIPDAMQLGIRRLHA